MAIVRILTTQVGSQERVLPLGALPIRLGRADDNDVVLLEQAASRHHARIEPAEGGYDIVDLGSSAGLILRGARVDRHRLVDGDEITIGGTQLRFVAHPGSESTVLPVAAGQPSSQPTQGAVPLPPNPFSDADTMLPTSPISASKTDPALADTGPNASIGGSETIAAEHEPAQAPPPATPATVLAEHQPLPPPPTPIIEPVPVPNDPPPKSSPSFVMGGDGASSPSNYTLEGNASPGNAASGGYSFEGERKDNLGGFALDTVPPTALRAAGPGVGTYIMFAIVGAGASFGIMIALQGVPW